MNILAFLAFCVVVTYTPGPANVVILATAQNQGPRKALEFVAGAALAIALLLALSAVLSGALLGLLPRVRPVIGAAGAAYMLYLAYRIATSGAPTGADARTGTFATGFAMQLVNPKVILFCLTVVATFVTPYAGSALAQSGLVGVIFAIMCSAMLTWVLLGAALRRFLADHRRPANLAMALFLVYTAWAVLVP